MLDNPTDTDAAKKSLVRTYANPSYADPWEAVEAYERVNRYTAEHPKQGSQAVSTAVGLPRDRIRAWVDSDGRPDCYRGLQIALINEWIVEEWNETARGLNQLAGWLMASGSINNNWVPLFVADSDVEVEALHDAAQAAGVSPLATREDETRPREWRPQADASVLGRVLHTWTGVHGDKSASEMQFPRYPRFARLDVARAFAKTYVNLRAITREDRPGPLLQIQEDRTSSYRETLVELLERVVSDPDEIQGESWPVYIRGDAVEELWWD